MILPTTIDITDKITNILLPFGVHRKPYLPPTNALTIASTLLRRSADKHRHTGRRA
ncbi:MAG: hypothetical protein R3E08_05480 [Thiotrichaceae bacterium]